MVRAPCRPSQAYTGPDRHRQHIMPNRPRIGLTGATGFVGRQLLPRLLQQGASVQALARPAPGRNMETLPGLEWVAGDLGSADALDRLTRNTDIVIHLAGATKARNRAAFDEVNATATGRLAGIAQKAGVKHFILVSSLAATRPHVSAYAASKAAGERLVRDAAGTMPVSIVRAPAVIGPGDMATHQMFRLLAKGVLPVPGGYARNHRFSVIDVEDLAAVLARSALYNMPQSALMAPASHLNVQWQDIADSAARVTGRNVRMVSVPAWLFSTVGFIADGAALLTGRPHVFSSGKVRELQAGDWLADRVVDLPTPLDTTMTRSLAPFLDSGRPHFVHSTGNDGSDM